ncbi:MAG: cytochrome c [Chloroflexi bacterium]|nr:cytochrome c [Chloroflexota bacterium]
MKIKDTMLVPLFGIFFVMALAFTLIVKIVIMGPYTHHNIRPTIDPSYERTEMSFVGASYKTSDVAGQSGLPEPSVAGASTGESGIVAAGRAVVEKNCSACHPGGRKGIGPDLGAADFKTRYPQDSDIEKVVRSGRNVMPAWSTAKVSDDELKAVIAFIRSLSGGNSSQSGSSSAVASPTPSGSGIAPAIAPPSPAGSGTSSSSSSAGSSEKVAAGKAVVEKNCSACHPGGHKGIGPDLGAADFKTRYPQDSDIEKVIRGGRNVMPAWSTDKVNDSDLGNVIAFIRSLSGGS